MRGQAQSAPATALNGYLSAGAQLNATGHKRAGQQAHMAPALLQNGLLKDGLALAGVYHVVNLSLSRLLACHNVRPSLYHLPAGRRDYYFTLYCTI